MVNLYAPHKVFISNSGNYVVSLDDWGGVGIGKNVLAIYKNGVLSKRYTLPEISPVPLYDYYKTISSIWWFEKFIFINDYSFKITFGDKNGKKFERYFFLETTD